MATSVYNAAKAGVVSLTKSASAEYGRKGVRVNCICPGFIETEIMGASGGSQFPEIANPNSTGELQKLDEPGRPDLRQSMRGPATGLRVSIPVLNITKTRLNDPTTWFLGTNDNPGDYRNSGCASCHVVYANSRDVKQAGPYGGFGNRGTAAGLDPTLATAWRDRGSARLQKGDREGALTDFTRAVELDPTFPDVWAKRSHARLEEGA